MNYDSTITQINREEFLKKLIADEEVKIFTNHQEEALRGYLLLRCFQSLGGNGYRLSSYADSDMIFLTLLNNAKEFILAKSDATPQVLHITGPDERTDFFLSLGFQKSWGETAVCILHQSSGRMGTNQNNTYGYLTEEFN